MLPKIEEQLKIAQFFEKLDELVVLHQRKLTDLQTQKQSLLQKMFPKTSESVPELRFAGYTYAWEQSHLGNIMNVTSVKRIHQSD
jgi:type I restriction enzyme S subunit